MINWTSATTFEIDGVKFLMDYTPGEGGPKSNSDEFVIVKFPTFIEQYEALRYEGMRNILEVGVFEGGSFAFLDLLLKPKKISAVELSPRPTPALDAYIARNGDRARLHRGVSQGDAAALQRIVTEDFGGEVDLVVDDASHFYELSKQTFLALYPLVRPGGLYILEDWAWSFHKPFQGPEAPWKDEKALVNLVFEFLEELSLNSSFAQLTITRDMVLIRKPLAANPAPLLSMHGRRGRDFPEL